MHVIVRTYICSPNFTASREANSVRNKSTNNIEALQINRNTVICDKKVGPTIAIASIFSVIRAFPEMSRISERNMYLLTTTEGWPTDGQSVVRSSAVAWICEKIARSSELEKTNGVRWTVFHPRIFSRPPFSGATPLFALLPFSIDCISSLNRAYMPRFSFNPSQIFPFFCPLVAGIFASSQTEPVPEICPRSSWQIWDMEPMRISGSAGTIIARTSRFDVPTNTR